MPVYLGKECSDMYLQGLIEAYRDGQRSVGAAVEDSDQVVIDRMTAENVIAPKAPSAFFLGSTSAPGTETEGGESGEGSGEQRRAGARPPQSSQLPADPQRPEHKGDKRKI